MEDWLLHLVALAASILVTLLLSSLLKPSRPRKTLPPLRRAAVSPVVARSSRSSAAADRISTSTSSSAASAACTAGTARSSPSAVSSPPAVFIADRVLAHRALVARGAEFADRPPAFGSSAVLSSNQRSISSAPYGPVWRALRRNLAAELLHPSRLRAHSPARRCALDLLVRDLGTESSDGAAAGVVVMESFQFAMFCLLVLMCFGERLPDEQIRRIESLQRDLLSNFISFSVLAVYPKITRLLFRSRWKKLMEIRRKQEETFVPLIDARRNNLLLQRRRRSEEDGFVYSYVDSLVDLEIRRTAKEADGRRDRQPLLRVSERRTTRRHLAAVDHGQPRKAARRADETVRRNRTCGREGRCGARGDLQRMPYLKPVLEGLRRHPPGSLCCRTRDGEANSRVSDPKARR
ncbi:Cytochrome P450 89A2 [Ananas comosus]|uniref:Cytochrome P450 89A2 n=1 Tax=Ananas comosus TaxID=4615 RepID=A0A199VP35_ANACO|nr:Cytochrome P450 89A2 [Ananas comosus]